MSRNFEESYNATAEAHVCGVVRELLKRCSWMRWHLPKTMSGGQRGLAMWTGSWYAVEG